MLVAVYKNIRLEYGGGGSRDMAREKRGKGGKHNEPSNDCFAWRRRRRRRSGGMRVEGRMAQALSQIISRAKCTYVFIPPPRCSSSSMYMHVLYVYICVNSITRMRANNCCVQL